MARVLVADDDPQFAELLRVWLEEAGFAVETANSGIAAGAALERGGFDAAVLDVLMPGVSGDAIAEVAPRLPIVLMTGAPGNQFVGGQRVPVLRKPFPETLLLETLDRVLTRGGAQGR